MAESNFEIDVATPLTWRAKLIIADRLRQRAFYRYWTLFQEYFNADLYKITRVVRDFLGVFTVFYVFYLINRCIGLPAPLGQSVSWRVGSCYLGNSMSSTPPCTGLCSEEDKQASLHGVEKTREVAVYRL